MGRLIDAVLAVSALAIASAVAWADWEMSCCGVGVNSAMYQVLGGQVLIMVRIGEILRRGYDTKMSISLEPLVWFTSFLDTVYLRVCPTTKWCCFCSSDIMGCIWEHKMYLGWFSGLENTYNKERYSLVCSYCVLKWFLDVQCPA